MSRFAVPRQRRGRVKPTRILRINIRAPRPFNRRVAEILIADIEAGKARWPVDTGYSRRSFYFRGITSGGLVIWNLASYSRYLEGKGRYIERYWRRNRRSILRRAEAKTAEQSRPKRKLASIAAVVRNLTE